MKTTIIYCFVILVIIFRNLIITKIIDFNNENNTDLLLVNLLKTIKTINLKLIITLTFYIYFIILEKYIIYKIILFIIGIILLFYYRKINFFLNQLTKIYYNKYLINKFILF